jgi:lipopolysaccharide/colanic/teichoic acid biosynthesis glycosyltransferase
VTENSASFPTNPKTAVYNPKRNWFQGFIKRVFDIVVSVAGMILLFPLFLYLVIRIKRDSPGPIYYRGPRVGRNGKPFHILKFRTMYEEPESYQGLRVTSQHDSRITPVGRWLRDTKLNEIPQLWNVFIGDMSLVGPRPEDPNFVSEWPEDVRQEVLSVRPGITSPASIMYRDEENLLRGEKVMDIYLGEILPSKLRLDQLYVHHRSFWGDLDIIFWTLLVLLPQVSSYSPPEAQLFLGPISRTMRRHISWYIADTFITFAAMGLTGLFWRSMGPLDIGWMLALGFAISFAILFSLTNAILGVNRIEWSRAAPTDALDLIPGAFIATGIALIFNYFYPTWLMSILYNGRIPPYITRPLLPIPMILVASSLAVLGFIIVRYRSRLVTGLATRWITWRGLGSAAQERVLIIGGGETGQFAAWMLSHGVYAGNFRVIGFVDDDLYKQEARIHGVEVLGQRAQIPSLVANNDAGIIVFAIHNISARERRQVLEICQSTPARVVLFPDIPAALTGISRNGSPTEENRLHVERKESFAEGPTLLPCDLCLTKVSPIKVDSWLIQLQETAESGDLESLQEQIESLRSTIRGDVSTQLSANLAGYEEIDDG